MKKPIIINILILFFCFLSCICCQEQKRDNSNSGTLIKLSLNRDLHFLPADSVLGEKRIVPLETTQENIISKITKLEIYNHHLYILDETQDIIFIFDESGKYVAKIADFGRGPEEYLYISDFHVDDSTLYVLAGGNRKIMCYDLKGKLTESFPITYGGGNITTDSSYVYINRNFNHPQGFNVGVYSKKKHSMVKQYKSYPRQQNGSGYGHKAWTSYGNQIYASFHYEYNIYRLTPDTCTVFACLDCGADKMYPPNWNTFSPQQEEKYNKQKGGIIDLPIISAITSIFPTSKSLIFTFIYTSFEHIVFFDHLTHTVRYGILKPDSYHWNAMNKKVYVSDEYMVIATPASDVLSYGNRVSSAEAEKALNIKEDDNPCLYFYKLK